MRRKDPPHQLSFGAHVFLWAADGSTSECERAIEAASRLGLDFVQVSLSSLDLDLAAVRRSLEKHHLGCLTGLAVPPGVWAERRHGALHDYLKQAVDATAELGSGILSGALYTPMGERTDRMRRAEELYGVRQVLKEIAQYASSLGIALGLEPLNRYETSLMNTCQQALQFITELDEENVFVQLDTFHMNIEESDLRETIVSAGDRLGYLQLAESDRGVPGYGLIRWEEVFAGLREIHYEGPLAFESFTARNTILAEAACLWRDVVGDPDSFLVKGRERMRTSAERVGFRFPS